MNSGIYKIVCIITTDNYVGSAVNLLERFRLHKHWLKIGKHSNRYLQNVYNKYGPDNFIFEVIEYVNNKEDLIAREQFYIDTLNPKYNVLRIAGSSLGLKHTKESLLKMSEVKKGKNNPNYGKHRTEETKRKQSESHKGNKNPMYGKNHTEETLHKMSEIHKGRECTKETRYKISEANKGKQPSEKQIIEKSISFKLLSPQGQIIEGINVSKFCIENNLCRRHIWEVMNNKRKSHKGWTKYEG